jgi:hypothetical protein
MRESTARTPSTLIRRQRKPLVKPERDQLQRGVSVLYGRSGVVLRGRTGTIQPGYEKGLPITWLPLLQSYLHPERFALVRKDARSDTPDPPIPFLELRAIKPRPRD